MKRISAYQKLKQENLKLKQDIYNLVMNEHSEIGLTVKLRYKLKFDNDKIIWNGESSVFKFN